LTFYVGTDLLPFAVLLVIEGQTTSQLLYIASEIRPIKGGANVTKPSLIGYRFILTMGIAPEYMSQNVT